MLRLCLFLALGFALQLSTAAQTAGPVTSTTAAANQKAVPQANEPDLIDAIKKRDLSAVLQALDQGASPDSTDDEDTPALILAVQENRIDIAVALLNHHAKVDKIDDGRNSTALEIAAILGRPELVKLLIARGANVNHLDDHGHSVLFSAACAVYVSTLPGWMPASFMGLSDEEENQLSEMMGYQQIPALKLLLEAGADPDVAGRDCGLTALMIAALDGNAELTKLLLAHKAKTNIEAKGWTALRFAAEFESTANIQKELSRFGQDRASAFLTWVNLTRPGRQEVAELLRKAGAN